MTLSRFFFVFAHQFAILVCLPANAQQPAPPPAVLVQPAELRSMTKQAEFVGRAEALEKVDLRPRVQGFLGPRLFKEGDTVIFTSWAGDEFRERGGDTILVMREEDVLAVVDD